MKSHTADHICRYGKMHNDIKQRFVVVKEIGAKANEEHKNTIKTK